MTLMFLSRVAFLCDSLFSLDPHGFSLGFSLSLFPLSKDVHLRDRESPLLSKKSNS